MKVLIIGGTGLISTGILPHLRERGADVTLFNRGKRAASVEGVRVIHGDRNVSLDLGAERFDVVIDMVCFTPAQAEACVHAFAGKIEQLIFCSSVCAYGVETPASGVIDESLTPRPISDYGRDKLTCERRFERAQAEGAFKATVLRPSNTYGPGASLIDQMEFDSVVWDRVEHGLPVLCAGDGIGLWQSTHRADVGRLFAYAAGNPKTYGEAFNATHDRIFTWRDYYREAARALGTEAKLVLAPAGWVVAQGPQRFAFLHEVTRYHGAYSSAKAKAAVPEFQPVVAFEDGARETLQDAKKRGAWRHHEGDAEYSALVQRAVDLGFETLTA
ncbi:MAG: NAD-dependent epimerase/dehydratase family protein [Myxococcales bacterium]|nr:MAG: NAD-dependent epimerase/dehydratase family protein [Myxococcales bacterium]